MRRAGEADAAALALVAGATFLEAFAGVLAGPDIVAHCAAKSSAATFAAWIGDPSSVVVLAEADAGRAPIGYTVLTTSDLPVPPEDGDIELKRIYALAPTHGAGLGPALMARALDEARMLGSRRMLLGVYGGNVKAQRFYAKHAFQAIGTRRFQIGTSWHDDLIFGRIL